MRFVKNDKSVGQRASAHIRKRRNLYRSAFYQFLITLKPEHLLKSVVKRTKVRIDFFLQIARQKTEFFSRLDGRSRQNDFINLFCLVSRSGKRYGKIGFTRTRRTYGDGDDTLFYRLHVLLLSDRFRLDKLSAGSDRHDVVEQLIDFVKSSVTGAIAQIRHPSYIYCVFFVDKLNNFSYYLSGKFHVLFVAGKTKFSLDVEYVHVQFSFNLVDVFVVRTEQFDKNVKVRRFYFFYNVCQINLRLLRF